MNSEICTLIVFIIAQKLMVKLDAVVPSARLVEDLGADSLNMLEIVLDINEILEIEVPTEGVACVRSVEDLYRLVGRSLS